MEKIKHITLKEWKSKFENATLKEIKEVIFPEFLEYYDKNKHFMTLAENCAFNQLGFIYQERVK